MWAIYIAGIAITVIVFIVVAAIYIIKGFSAEMKKLSDNLADLSNKNLCCLIAEQQKQNRILEEIKVKGCSQS